MAQHLSLEVVSTLLLTDGSGVATATLSPVASGYIYAVKYVDPGAATRMATGAVDVTITTGSYGLQVMTLTNLDTTADRFYLPRSVTHDTSGVTRTYDVGALYSVGNLAPIVNEQISVAVAQGGANKVATFYFWIVTVR